MATPRLVGEFRMRGSNPRNGIRAMRRQRHGKRMTTSSTGTAPSGAERALARLDLRQFHVRPVAGHAATLDRRLLLGGEPRTLRLDDGGIDDLAAHREIAAVVQNDIEAIEQPRKRAGPSCSRNSHIFKSGTLLPQSRC